MKYNKAIYMTFQGGVSTSTANIHVPINVKKISVKSLTYVASTEGFSFYGFLMSDLVQNGPLGIIYQDSDKPFSQPSNIEYIFKIPQPIEGTYTFRLMNFDGTAMLATPGDDNIGMILEFSDE